MTNKEKIRAEIERLKENHERNLDKPMERGRIGHAHGYVDCCDEILDFINSLPEEPTPKGYNEAYLNECIAKASKTWKGFDVDKYMDEVRGRSPEELDDLEEVIDAEIVKDIHNLLHVKSEALPISTKHRFGDKVRIIIVK